MARDKIIEEVRRVREPYAARFSYDLDAIYQDMKDRELRGEFTVIRRRPRRPRAPQTKIPRRGAARNAETECGM
jgi:hypothetical protein